MKNAIKYTAAMLLVSAGLNAYAAPKISTSGRIKVDVGSTKVGSADWSGANVDTQHVELSLNIETEQFAAKVTLDAGEWYNNALLIDGSHVTNNPKDLNRLLDEAYITFSATGGQVTLGKQHIILIPNLETSSLEEESKKEQVIAVRFTTEGKAMLAGIGIDVALYETESYDNKIGDDFGINVILSKDINQNLKVYLAVQSEEDSAEEDRQNRITARGVYTVNPKLQISAQYQSANEDSSLAVGAEYALTSDMMVGASFKSTERDKEDDSNTIKVYGTKQLSKDITAEVFWSNKSQDSGNKEEDKEQEEDSLGFRINVQF